MAERGEPTRDGVVGTSVKATLIRLPGRVARRPLSLLAAVATVGVAVLLVLSLAGGRFSSLRLGGIASAPDTSTQSRTAQPVSSGPTITALAMVAPNDGWAAAWNNNTTDGSNPGMLLRYDGRSWTRVASPVAQPIQSISMLSSHDGWAVAGTSFLHYTNGRWALDSTYTPDGQATGISVSLPINIFQLQMVAADDGWAIGMEPSDTGDSRPLLLRYQQGHWAKQPLPVTAQFQVVRAISMVSPSEGWIVGSNYSDDYRQETPLVLHYSDAQWTPVATGFDGALTGVSALPGGEVWGVGEVSPGMGPGLILHYRDGVWRQEASPTPNMLHAITMRSATDGWIAGDGAATLHWDGTRWTKVGLVIHGVGLWQLAMVSPNEGWAAGPSVAANASGGVLLHYAKGSWSVYKLPA